MMRGRDGSRRDVMGEKFEEMEHQKFGAAGFRGIVQKVTELEKILGIYDLGSFTLRAARSSK